MNSYATCTKGSGAFPLNIRNLAIHFQNCEIMLILAQGTCILDDFYSQPLTGTGLPSYTVPLTTTVATKLWKSRWKSAIKPNPEERMGNKVCYLQFSWDMVLAFLNLTPQFYFSMKGDLVGGTVSLHKINQLTLTKLGCRKTLPEGVAGQILKPV